jgi:hypothetical protein
VRIGRRNDNSILGGANNDAPFSQIYGNFLRRICLRVCGGRKEPRMHTDTH